MCLEILIGVLAGLNDLMFGEVCFDALLSLCFGGPFCFVLLLSSLFLF